MIPLRPTKQPSRFAWASACLALVCLGCGIWFQFFATPDSKADVARARASFMFRSYPVLIQFYYSCLIWGAGSVLEQRLSAKQRLIGLGTLVGLIALGFVLLTDDPGITLACLCVSGIIVGLAATIAPQDEVLCFDLSFGIRRLWSRSRSSDVYFLFDVSMFGLVFWYAGILLYLGSAYTWGILALPLMIVVLACGGGLGWAATKYKWIPSEGWDLFAVLSGKSIKKRQQQAKAEAAGIDPNNVSPADPLAGSKFPLEQQLTDAISAGDSATARNAWEVLNQKFAKWKPTAPLMLEFAELMAGGYDPDLAVKVLENYLTLYPGERETVVRLKLASLYVKPLQRPRKALQVLSELPTGDLGNEKYNRTRDKLGMQANDLILSGVLEVQI